jgi:hypothetical protein
MQITVAEVTLKKPKLLNYFCCVDFSGGWEEVWNLSQPFIKCNILCVEF